MLPYSLANLQNYKFSNFVFILMTVWELSELIKWGKQSKVEPGKGHCHGEIEHFHVTPTVFNIF